MAGPIVDYGLASQQGAKYQSPAGWKSSGYWSVYADQFAQDGSEDQVIAALTRSVPEQWLRDRGIGDDQAWADAPNKTTMSDIIMAQGIKKANEKPEDYYLGNYAKSLQKRLRDNFQKNKPNLENQGVANLRAETEDALQSDFKNVDANANARGLLYSGKRDAGRAAAANQRATELGKSVNDFTQGLADTERNLNSDVITSDIGSALQTADINDIMSNAFYNKLERGIQSDRQQAAAAGALGGGVGSFIGNYYGAKKKGS